MVLLLAGKGTSRFKVEKRGAVPVEYGGENHLMDADADLFRNIISEKWQSAVARSSTSVSTSHHRVFLPPTFIRDDKILTLGMPGWW